MPSKKTYFALPPGPLRIAATLVERLVTERINNEVSRSFVLGRGAGKVLHYKSGTVTCAADTLPPNIPILSPSFIPKAMWDRMVGTLLEQSTKHRTKSNVWLRQYLFPLIDDQEAFIANTVTMEKLYEVFAARIHSYRLESGITPLRAVGETLYYFDEHDILRRRSDLPYRWLSGFKASMTDLEISYWDLSMTRMKEGMSMRQCVDVALNGSPKRPEKGRYTEFERLAQKIFEPEFERVPENTDRRTFDRVRVAVGIGSMHPNLRETAMAIRSIRPKLDRLVIEAIQRDPRCQRYGVPVKDLHLCDLTLTPDHLLEYIFELRS